MNGAINKKKNIKILTFSLLLLFILLALFSINKSNKLDYSPYIASEKEILHVKVLVVGDIMLDRNVRNIIDRKGFDFFFSGVKDLIQNADIAIGNLEGAFTPYASLTSDLKSKELIFTFNPAHSLDLSELGFDVLGLANNHSYNFGKSGLEMTRRYIGSSGMLYYGDPFNKDEISTIITKNGLKIGLVGFHEFYYTNFEKVLFEITNLKDKTDFIIVTPHWGPEYEKKPTDKMIELAHQFIDNGADAVIGTHPHVIGDTEIYRNKKIYYSLGNFAFDQYFSKATMEGLAVIIDIVRNKDNVDAEYEEVKVKVDKEGVKVMDNK